MASIDLRGAGVPLPFVVWRIGLRFSKLPEGGVLVEECVVRPTGKLGPNPSSVPIGRRGLRVWRRLFATPPRAPEGYPRLFTFATYELCVLLTSPQTAIVFSLTSGASYFTAPSPVATLLSDQERGWRVVTVNDEVVDLAQGRVWVKVPAEWRSNPSAFLHAVRKECRPQPLAPLKQHTILAAPLWSIARRVAAL